MEEEEEAEQAEEEGGEFGREQGEGEPRGAESPSPGGRALAGRKREREVVGARERRCSPSSLLMQHMKNEWCVHVCVYVCVFVCVCARACMCVCMLHICIYGMFVRGRAVRQDTGGGMCV